MMCIRMLTVRTMEGLHVGPCYDLSRRAKCYSCSITVKTRRGVYNVKSGLQLLQAGLGPGEKAEFCFEGEKAETEREKMKIFIMQYFEIEEDREC